jgi:hypothetical protein
MTTLHQQKLTHRRIADGAQVPTPGYLPFVQITDISGDGEYLTFTTATAHGVKQWDLFYVLFCAPDVYNGAWIAHEITPTTVKAYSKLTDNVTRHGKLSGATPYQPLARYTYPLYVPQMEALPLPILGLIAVPGTMLWAAAYPVPGEHTTGSYTLHVRYLLKDAEVWDRSVLMELDYFVAAPPLTMLGFACNAVWSAGGSPDYSMPLPARIDEVTRDAWCNDRTDPKAWLELGEMGLHRFEMLEPCGVRNS